MTRKSSDIYGYDIDNTVPFLTAEEAWFWFIDAQDAKASGARIIKGAGLYNRPCEPVDILTVLDRLYRGRRLQRDHLLVLRHYGRRKMPPDPRRVKEKRAFVIWQQALEILEEVLISKGIVAAGCNSCAGDDVSSVWAGIPIAEMTQQVRKTLCDQTISGGYL